MITDFGFSIDYPSGWLADTFHAGTYISEFEIDQRLRNASGGSSVKGHSVYLNHEPISILGLTENPSLQDLRELSFSIFGWQQPTEESETVVFGVPALSVNYRTLSGQRGNVLLGFLNDEAFLLSITAPTEEAIARIMPTWTKMLESIKPTPSPSAEAKEEEYAAAVRAIA